MRDLKSVADQILMAIKYCYRGDDGQPPLGIVFEEWHGDHQDPGAQQYVISLIDSERKRAFLDGFREGAMAVQKEYLNETEFNLDDNRIGGERAWAIYDRES